MSSKKKTPTQEGRELMNYFLNRYNEMYGNNPPGTNRTTLVFGFRDLYDDYGTEATGLIDYYFEGYIVHDPKTFLRKYGEMAEEKREEEEDAERRRLIRKRTRELMRERENE